MMSDDNVVDLNCITRLNLPPERILQKGIEADLEGVVIVGYSKDGNEYFASSYADAGQCAWLLQRGIYKLNQMCEQIEDEGLPA